MPPDNATDNQAHPDQILSNEEPNDQASVSDAAAEVTARDRFKAESPKIPGVGELQRQTTGIGPKYAVAIMVVLLFLSGVTITWIASRKHAGSVRAATPAELQIPTESPSPAPTPAAEANTDQVIATVAEMGKVWSSKEFVYRDVFSGLITQAVLVRLPKGSATQSSGYWAFAANAAYGNCKLEYLTDMSRLREDYGYRQGTHPMVGDPCSRSVIDPLKLSVMPGNVWVRGGVVQGVDVRPPLEIEVIVKGQKIIANRME